MKMGLKKRLTGLVWVALLVMAPHLSSASDTMLMFVGEDLEVVSIASKRKEAAWSAPAIARVISRKQMRLANSFTLARTMRDVAGFYINHREKGATAYLRGIPDAALSLFDTVPLGSGVVKSDPFMYEMPTAPVKQVEIVRGSSSVLWGPDAFAGVVNVVPLTGRDFQGIELGVISGNEINPGEAYVNMGHDHGDWNSFLSVSIQEKESNDHGVNLVGFWPEGRTQPVPAEQRYGNMEPENDRAAFVYANWAYKDFLTISAWLSAEQNAFVLSDWEHKYFWQEQTDSLRPGCKIEMSHALTPDSSIRFTGYVSGLSQDHAYIDREFTRKEFSYFGEMIYDQSLFFSRALATLGVSLRYDEYDDVLLWDSFLPNFLEIGNTQLLPRVRLMDMSNQLLSVFGQYRHKIGSIEFWGGLRSDFHENYEDKISYNAGASWHIEPFILKATCGTGYRTPFVRQVRDGDSERLEKIENVNIQASWRKEHTKASVCLFHNKVKNHVVEDRYAGAGLSSPNSQRIYGAEVELEHEFFPWFSLVADMTLLDNSGSKETYLFLDYIYTDENGVEKKYYRTLEHDYDSGPDFMGTIRGVIHLGKHISLEPRVRYFARRELFSPLQNDYASCDSVVLTDINVQIRDLFFADVFFYAHNLFDHQYESPGGTSITEIGRFSAGIALRMKF